MVDTSWAERRRRMVKCKAHGLHYDPEMSTGCARCLREAAKAVRKRPPQLVIILLCLLGMASILFYIFGPLRGGVTHAIDLGVATSPTYRIERLDPEPFRQALEGLEVSLFQTPIDETADLLVVSADIASSTAYLSTRILEAEPVAGVTTADLVARLGQQMPTDQVIMADVERARGQWLRIRRQRLKAADWFYDPSKAAESSETTSIADYSDIASGLQSLVLAGVAEVQALNDSEAGGIVSESAGEQWRVFTRDWSQQVASLESRLPARPGAQADGRLLAAIQDLEQALGQLRALTSEPNPPSAEDNRFEDTVNLALRAQQGFDELSQ